MPAVAMQATGFCLENPVALANASSLAAALYAQGKYADAVAAYGPVVDVKKRVLGPDHPETIIISGNLARALYAHGEHAEAVDLFADVVARMVQVLGPEHGSTLHTMKSHARARRSLTHTRILVVLAISLAIWILLKWIGWCSSAVVDWIALGVSGAFMVAVAPI
jgi:tetratricopeptide (TPR) repeat protein